MAVNFKNDKKPEAKAAPVALPDAKIETAVGADAPEVVAEAPEVVALKKQLSDAENREKSEREQRISAEKAATEANTKVVSSQNDAIKAQKTAIENAEQVAIGNVTAIKRELQEAMEAGDLAKQVDLQEKLADARWTFNNAAQTKKNFTAWEEQQKNAPKVDNAPKYTRTEQAWIDAHPRFNTDDDYYGVVAGADAAARRKGIKPDTTAYYEYVETALKRSGLEESDAQKVDNGRDNTGAMEQEDEEEEVVVTKKPKLVVPSAPATNASPTSATVRSAKSFKLTPEMRDMAHRMFGPNSSHKLSEKLAEEKYAAHQLDIRERRANGERV